MLSLLKLQENCHFRRCGRSATTVNFAPDLHRKRVKNPCALCSAVAYCCGAVAPRAIAALLGRFLPRLGPPANASGPFFLGSTSIPCHSGTRSEPGISNSPMCNCKSEVHALRAPQSGMNLALFRGRLERSELAERNGGQRVRQCGDVGGHLLELRAAFATPFVHVDRAVEVELDGVESRCRTAG